MIDLRFTDLPGSWQHFSVPPSAVDAATLEKGIGFDGSSIRGFQEIQESDMLVVPDPATHPPILFKRHRPCSSSVTSEHRSPDSLTVATLVTSHRRPRST